MKQQSKRRNTLRILSSGAILTGCQTISGSSIFSQNSSSPSSNIADNQVKSLNISTPPKNFDVNSRGFTPQFFDGRKQSKKLIEIGFSMHCGGTREWFKINGKRLASDIKSGRKAALFSHVIRHSNELPVGVELMKVGSKRYPAAVYATLGLSLHLNRPVSAAEVRLFLRESGFTYVRNFSKENAEIGLLGVQRAYREGMGVKVTPFVKETRIS